MSAFFLLLLFFSTLISIGKVISQYHKDGTNNNFSWLMVFLNTGLMAVYVVEFLIALKDFWHE